MSIPRRPGGRTRRPVVLVTHSYFEEDPRLRRQAQAILDSGRAVDVIALRRPGDQASGDVAGVRLIRLDVQRHQGAGAVTYLAEYLAFFLRASLRLAREHARRRYALVQVATLPDWLVFAALPVRLTGVPVLLDLHEAMPEFFAARFPSLDRAPIRRVLRLAEAVSIRASSHAITVNSALRDRLLGLGFPAAAISVVPNSPSLRLFDPEAFAPRPLMADGTLRLVYAGAVTPTYELDVAARAVARLRARRPGLAVELDVFGRGDSEGPLAALIDELGLRDMIHLHGRVPVEDVPGIVAAADVGLAPTRLTGFTRDSLSTKIFEYAAMDKPVIASRLPLIERELPADGVGVYASGDPDSLADAILQVVDDAAVRSRRVDAMRRHVAEHSWERDALGYVRLIDRLATG